VTLGPLFITPCYGGLVHSAHFRSCLNLKEFLTKENVPHDWIVAWNESLITRARNELAATFLQTEYSHLFFLDADIEFEPWHVANIWNMQADIGVGVYAMKKRDQQLFAAWKDGALVTDLAQYREPIEVDFAGTGFMCISRNVIETLAKTAETYTGPNGEVSALFMTPIHNHGFQSEDYHFCRKAREAGFKVIMDPAVRLVHWGQYGFGA